MQRSMPEMPLAVDERRSTSLMEFRSLVIADLASMNSIESSVYAEPWSERLLRDSLGAPMTHTLGLFLGPELISYSIYQVILDEAHLLNLAVRKEFQGQGFGSKNLDHIIESLRKRSVRSFFLEVRPSNERAKTLYKRRGFETLFVRQGYYANGENAEVMCLLLQQPF